MTARTLVLTGSTILMLGCTPKPIEQQFIDDAMRAVGGRARVEAVKSIVIEGTGVNYYLGQDLRPEAATHQFAITDFKREIDLEQGRQRVQQTRTPKFAFFQGPQAQTQVQVLDGDIAFNVDAKGGASRVGTALAERDRRTDFFHHPLTALKAATAPITTISNVRTVGTVRQADFAFRDRVWTMMIDSAGLPLSISTRTSHPNLGDVMMITTFDDYREANGLRLPAKLTGKIDEFTIYEIQAAKQSVDAALGDMAAPAAVLKPAPPAPPNVTAEPIAKGVWLLGGQSHHSALIEFADHLMLIDAPQSEARTLAVIKKARETVPKKPLRHLVTTHHHFDHTAGLRAAIAEGLNVITHAGNKEWVENMARRPHTLLPDFLAKNVSRLNVETVDTEREFRDQTMIVMLYHVAGSPHSDTMLMAYLPRERVLVEVDVFGPGSQVHPYAANLLENIQKRNLRVDKIVPLHGAPVPFAELTKVAGGK